MCHVCCVFIGITIKWNDLWWHGLLRISLRSTYALWFQLSYTLWFVQIQGRTNSIIDLSLSWKLYSEAHVFKLLLKPLLLKLAFICRFSPFCNCSVVWMSLLKYRWHCGGRASGIYLLGNPNKGTPIFLYDLIVEKAIKQVTRAYRWRV